MKQVTEEEVVKIQNKKNLQQVKAIDKRLHDLVMVGNWEDEEIDLDVPNFIPNVKKRTAK